MYKGQRLFIKWVMHTVYDFVIRGKKKCVMILFLSVFDTTVVLFIVVYPISLSIRYCQGKQKVFPNYLISIPVEVFYKETLYHPFFSIFALDQPTRLYDQSGSEVK